MKKAPRNEGLFLNVYLAGVFIEHCPDNLPVVECGELVAGEESVKFLNRFLTLRIDFRFGFQDVDLIAHGCLLFSGYSDTS